MSERPQLTEEMVAGPARIRIDVLGGAPREHVLDDLSFLTYRLADVRIATIIAPQSRAAPGPGNDSNLPDLGSSGRTQR